MFYGAETFPSRERDLFGMAQQCKRTHGQISDQSLNTSLVLDDSHSAAECDPDVSSTYLS